ncbi:Craniofacial development protein 2 [Eumeta japonica]|uniref:Craniofacial development protein 2 n=1 Tax=Eumeta variegata TaxID=151549 RepID=A0A4C1TWL0_EUMVA|nr:Craniofacial development protein 2 [Eumeta japonica]
MAKTMVDHAYYRVPKSLLQRKALQIQKQSVYKYPPPSRLVLVGDEDHNPQTTQENNYENCENSHRRAKIYVAALNVLTLKNDENLTELTHALKQIKWDIVGLSESDTTSMDSFYLELNKTIQDHAHKNLVVTGDFNGQIGERQPVEDIVLGPFIYGKKARSKNGERLVNFAQENALKILNTKFKRKESKMWTWISPDGKTKNEIDFIMTNKSKYFSNMKVISNFNFNTNHRIIRAELTTTPLKNPRPRNIVMNTKRTKHQTDQIANSITTNLIDYNKETTNMEVQEKYNWLEGTIKAAIKQGNSKDQSNQWMTKIINLINQRADLINGKNTNDSRKQIAKLSKI